MVAVAHQRLTPQEYLEIERRAETKSEFFNGEMWAMSGARRPHNVIVSNLTSSLVGQLEEAPCEVYAADMRVRVSDTGLYTYPDVVVACDEIEFLDEREDTLLTPTLIIEVLSDSTESYDRGDKFAHYRRLPSLREYVMVAHNRIRVERFERRGDEWVLTELDRLEDVLELTSIDCRLTLAEVYRKVALPAEPPPLRGVQQSPR
jgi:Uma2 family endonuclease